MAPARKPGLWKQTMTSAGRTMVSTICLDAATDRKMSAFGQQAGQQSCSKNAMMPVPGGWRFESVCSMGSSGTISAVGTASGNFQSRYVVKARSTTAGAKVAAMNGIHEMTLESVWSGACPPGTVPGDMTMPGGMKMNILKLPSR